MVAMYINIYRGDATLVSAWRVSVGPTYRAKPPWDCAIKTRKKSRSQLISQLRELNSLCITARASVKSSNPPKSVSTIRPSTLTELNSDPHTCRFILLARANLSYLTSQLPLRSPVYTFPPSQLGKSVAKVAAEWRIRERAMSVTFPETAMLSREMIPHLANILRYHVAITCC